MNSLFYNALRVNIIIFNHKSHKRMTWKKVKFQKNKKEKCFDSLLFCSFKNPKTSKSFVSFDSVESSICGYPFKRYSMHKITFLKSASNG